MPEQSPVAAKSPRTSPEPRGGQHPRRQARVGLALALAAGALVTVSIGLLEQRMLATPHPIPYFHLFFSDPLYMKAWLASAALALAFGQLVTAAAMYGWFRMSRASPGVHLIHRWSGRVAMALTLPVAVNCLFELGVTPPDWRVMVHAVFGAFIYGVFVTKLFLVRQSTAPGWALPIAGSALFTTVLVLWITSAYWLFNLYGVHL
ncbi:MAG TPA: DUF6529 family protein [Ktedonobacterales bacterium]